MNVSQFEELLSPEQREELEQVREALLSDPKALDNHSRENR